MVDMLDLHCRVQAQLLFLCMVLCLSQTSSNQPRWTNVSSIRIVEGCRSISSYFVLLSPELKGHIFILYALHTVIYEFLFRI